MAPTGNPTRGSWFTTCSRIPAFPRPRPIGPSVARTRAWAVRSRRWVASGCHRVHWDWYACQLHGSAVEKVSSFCWAILDPIPVAMKFQPVAPLSNTTPFRERWDRQRFAGVLLTERW
eukprot:8170488-Pyramimonas_sp.AAC.1